MVLILSCTALRITVINEGPVFPHIQFHLPLLAPWVCRRSPPRRSRCCTLRPAGSSPGASYRAARRQSSPAQSSLIIWNYNMVCSRTVSFCRHSAGPTDLVWWSERPFLQVKDDFKEFSLKWFSVMRWILCINFIWLFVDSCIFAWLWSAYLWGTIISKLLKIL